MNLSDDAAIIIGRRCDHDEGYYHAGWNLMKPNEAEMQKIPSLVDNLVETA
jgi:hypothetical protein